MQFLLTCTTEELTLLVTMCGYPHVAKGVAEETLGKKSSKEWEAIMEATTHQLMLKQIWDDEKFANDEVPLTEDMQAFIKSYVEAKWMIRCSDYPRESALMIHHFEGEKWLRHIIHKDIIHEFSYIGAKEISEQINDYYSFEIDQSHIKEEFIITDEAFDLLSDKNRIKKVRKMSSFSIEEETSFNKFISDLENEQWSLYNISYFNIPHYEKDPYLENIVFFLPSPNGIWLAEYTDNPTKPVHIHLAPSEEWDDLLAGVSTVASYAM
ncbi:hypothetical protein [Bacillus sp. CECT 9360]|uniref:hypothetical protein n=1 Tax=Bacillus sp. CECT 9360 TaxID=2845821 RepID=UPI001E52F5B9|nr:hypothetical protein [Bacillus sp. CECT 9360]CAH0347267.1 hypothetical protein BCI9360_03658 [Bacillus sp. CECT 9360]